MEEIVRLGRCLADERCLRILAMLRVGGDLCVCELRRALLLSAYQIVPALKKLTDYGWIVVEDEGGCSVCRLVPSPSEIASEVLGSFETLQDEEPALVNAVNRLRERRGCERRRIPCDASILKPE